MRSALVLVLALCAVAQADELKKYGGKIVISSEAAPATSDQLPAYLAENTAKDGHYELIRAPWQAHFAGILAKDPDGAVTLVVYDEDDAKHEPLLSTEVSSRRRIVIVQATLTPSAGFAARRTYAVQLVADGKVLAKSELTLRN
jgi:hypothetical protein